MNTAAKSLIFTIVAALAVGAAQAQKSKMHIEIDPAKLPPPSTQKGVTFAKDIRPLLEAACVRCHGDEKQKAELRLDSLEAVLKGSENGKVVIPGDSAKSLLVIASSRLDEESAMPPRRRVRELVAQGTRGAGGSNGQNQADRATPLPPVAAAPGPGDGGRASNGEQPSKPLTPEQVGLVRAWIDQGAK